MGGVIVSLGRCACLYFGGVFAGLVTLCWGGLVSEKEKGGFCVCVCVQRTLLYIQTLKEGTASSVGTVQM